MVMDSSLGGLLHPRAGALGMLCVKLWGFGESKAWSWETAGENEFRLWRIILSHSVVFYIPPTWKVLNQMESNIYSKCKPFLAAAQHSSISQTLVVLTIGRPWKSLDPPSRTESSKGSWTEANELSETEINGKMSFGAQPIKTERSLNILIYHWKKLAQSHLPK